MRVRAREYTRNTGREKKLRTRAHTHAHSHTHTHKSLTVKAGAGQNSTQRRQFGTAAVRDGVGITFGWGQVRAGMSRGPTAPLRTPQGYRHSARLLGESC